MKKLIISLVWMIGLSTAANAAEDRLVTLTGELKPEFSFQVSETDMKRLYEDLKTIADLPAVTIDVNSLMEPGDEASIKSAANNIAGKFLRAAKILVDLKAMVYRLDALDQVYENDNDRDNLRDAFKSKFKTRYTELLTTLSLIEWDMIGAIEGCRSELCVNKTMMAQRTLGQFGELLNYKAAFGPKTVKFISPLFRASVEGAYRELQAKQDNYGKTISAAVAGFVAASRGEMKFKDLMGRAMASKKVLNKLGLEVPELGADIFVTEENWLREIGKARLREIVLGQTLPRPWRLQHARLHVWYCSVDGDDGEPYYHIFVYGQRSHSHMTCRNGRDPEVKINFKMKTIGPGLAFNFFSKFIAVIAGPMYTDGFGTWAGPSVSVQVIAGGELGVLVGKGGSALTLLGGHLGGAGVRAGITALTFEKPEGEPMTQAEKREADYQTCVRERRYYCSR